MEKQKRNGSVKEAQQRYDAQQRKILIRLDRRTEADLIEKLESVGSMQAYIKALVRADMTPKYDTEAEKH